MAAGLSNGSFRQLRTDPDGCARWLSCEVDLCGVTATVVAHDQALTVLALQLAPPPQLPGWPAEDVRLVVAADPQIVAVPVDADQRRWAHRYPKLSLSQLSSLPLGRHVPWEHLFGALCLQYPADPAHLRWRWADGIDAYIRIVQRHLWSEEFWRRHGHWPAEDAPHGHRLDGTRHPILTPELRSP